MNEELIAPKGVVYITIEEYDSSNQLVINNRVLRTGRIALAKSLANDFGSSFDYFINAIAFGSGGTSGNVPRVISDDREGLFGTTIINKSVISSINPDTPTMVSFTTVLGFDDANGSIINEILLKMRNGEGFSMATFGDITKTSSMQLTFKWNLSMV